jgi:hypothetical protein
VEIPLHAPKLRQPRSQSDKHRFAGHRLGRMDARRFTWV